MLSFPVRNINLVNICISIHYFIGSIKQDICYFRRDIFRKF